MQDLIDRLREYASTRKGELAELIIEAVDALEKQTCDDVVSRQAAIDALKRNTFRLTFAEEQNCEGHVAWSAEAVYSEVMEGALLELPSVQTCDDAVSRQAAIKTLEKGLPSELLKSKYTEGITVGFGLAITWIEQLPAVQPQRKTDEWCTDCKEYDAEKHCCPRFNRVIRQTLSEQPEIVRCKDCKYADDDGVCQNSVGLVIQDDDDFCSRAERREHGFD